MILSTYEGMSNQNEAGVDAFGRKLKFKHQPCGTKEVPRFPKFIGFREAWDR